MSIKKLKINAPLFIGRSDASRERDAVSVTLNYGRWHPENGPAAFNQSIEIQREDVGTVIAALIAIKDEIDALKVTV